MLLAYWSLGQPRSGCRCHCTEGPLPEALCGSNPSHLLKKKKDPLVWGALVVN